MRTKRDQSCRERFGQPLPVDDSVDENGSVNVGGHDGDDDGDVANVNVSASAAMSRRC